MYEKIALEAFKVREECEGLESGGIAPLIDKIATRTEDNRVYISYCYKAPCGLSDCQYSADTSMRECVYEFKDGTLTRDNHPIFTSPWTDALRIIQEKFFEKYSNLISSAEF